MKKNDIIKELESLVALVEDKEKFSEKYELKDGEFYPFTYGFLVSDLKYILDCAKGNSKY